MNSDPASILAQLRRLGAHVTIVGKNLRIDSPIKLPVALQVDARFNKAGIFALIQAEAQTQSPTHAAPSPTALPNNAYRHVLRRTFGLLAAGPEAPIEECERFMREEARLADELGEGRARQIRRAEGQVWWQETGRCPYCGELGELHTPTSETAGAFGTRPNSLFLAGGAAVDATPRVSAENTQAARTSAGTASGAGAEFAGGSTGSIPEIHDIYLLIPGN